MRHRLYSNSLDFNRLVNLILNILPDLPFIFRFLARQTVAHTYIYDNDNKITSQSLTCSAECIQAYTELIKIFF